MIRHFTESGHQVYVASLARSEQEAAQGGGIAAHCHRYSVIPVQNWVQNLRMVGRLPTPAPSSFGYFYSPAMARQVKEWLADPGFDLIFVHCSSVAGYVADVKGIPKILDFGDMDSQKWLDYSTFRSFPLSSGYWLEGTKLERVERNLARHFDLCTTTTRAEFETLESYQTGARTDWFPNGVDSDYFTPTLEPYEPHTISFIGRMDYYPNQECMFDFCRRTLPLLQNRFPDLKLLIVGASPSPEVKKLAELPGVTVTGSVPDVRPHVRRSAVMVAPLNIARGTQNKILEAMAMGVPVVSSRLAARGVDCTEGDHLLAADHPEEYAEAITRLMIDQGQRAKLAEAGRARMTTHHSWPKSMQRLDGIIERVLNAGCGAVSQANAAKVEA